MCVALDSSSVRLADFTRTTTFRGAVAVAAMFAVYMLLLFAVIYWQTGRYLTARSDAVVEQQAQVFAAGNLEERLIAVDQLLRQDPRGVQYAGLFAPDGSRIAGN